jgi:hypothetical protein
MLRFMGSFQAKRIPEPRERFFRRRLNLDGTCDSICLNCFKTIATTSDEEELDTFNRQHVCDPFLVAKFKMIRKTSIRL